MKRKVSAVTPVKGLVLDDFIRAIRDVRIQFELPKPRFALPNLKRYPSAKTALADFVKATIERHGMDILVAPGVLSLESGHEIYLGEPVGELPRYRLREGWLDLVLAETLETALQTIAQLPSRDKPPLNRSRTIKSIVSRLRKSASELNEMRARWPDLDGRLKYSLGFDRVGQIAEEFERFGNELEAVVSKAAKMTSFRINPPNPQVSLALYVCEFFRVSTGSQQYKGVTTLIEAAFWAAGKPIPKWVDRLAVEMSRKRRLRKKWARSIRLSSPHGTSQK
jgi:hypothetical protein